MSDTQFAIGVDLGTTHCALAYVPLREEGGALEVMATPQLTALGQVEALPLLPSFIYLPHTDELSVHDLALPWAESGDFAVGELARQLGTKTPLRLVASAKSWLSHPSVDRRAPLLPLNAPKDVTQLSPLEATVRYLTHLKAAWQHQHPEAPLAEQDVTITVPASFDPAARELTAEAAQHVGLGHYTLLEEPQAALYNWIQAHPQWREQVRVGALILVVDVGGGTSDFSLIAVTEQDGNLALERIAVGEHILLGGDNMDLALAHRIKAKLADQGTELEPWQIQGLTHGCRNAKETLLADPKQESVPVVVPSRGSRLVGGTLRTELTQAELSETLLEGFFPRVDVDARPTSRARGALTQLGLPYAQDPAISRHLAAFLAKQTAAAEALPNAVQTASQGRFLHPTAVLFNGGVFKAQSLAQRCLAILNDWLQADGAEPAQPLGDTDLDLAVARGAAYYSEVRRGRGVRIRGGTARAYYLGIESAMPAVPGVEPPLQALCIAPFGMEEGSEAELPAQEFGLVVGEPVRFRFFGSSVRREDRVGTLLEDWSAEELTELPPVEATLPAEDRAPGEVVPVRLHALVTEVGTLRLEAVPREGDERWKVELDVRGED